MQRGVRSRRKRTLLFLFDQTKTVVLTVKHLSPTTALYNDLRFQTADWLMPLGMYSCIIYEQCFCFLWSGVCFFNVLCLPGLYVQMRWEQMEELALFHKDSRVDLWGFFVAEHHDILGCRVTIVVLIFIESVCLRVHFGEIRYFVIVNCLFPEILT